MTIPDFYLWTVYDHPSDYPGCFVARRWVLAEGQPAATEDFRIGLTLDEVRAALPDGLTRIARDPADDGPIVEVWL